MFISYIIIPYHLVVKKKLLRMMQENVGIVVLIEYKIKQYNGLTETNRYCIDQILKMHIHILIFIWYAK